MPYHLLIFLFMISATVYGQESIYKKTIVINEYASVHGEYKNIDKFYPTFYNWVTIMVEGINCDDLNLKGENFDIHKFDAKRSYQHCYFYIKCLHPTDSFSKMQIFDKDKYVQDISFSGSQFLKELPRPQIQLDKEPIGHFHETYRLYDSLYCFAPFNDDYNDNVKLTVVSFTIELTRKGELFYSEHIIGAKYSDKVREQYRQLFLGDSVHIKSLIIKDEQS